MSKPTVKPPKSDKARQGKKKTSKPTKTSPPAAADSEPALFPERPLVFPSLNGEEYWRVQGAWNAVMIFKNFLDLHELGATAAEEVERIMKERNPGSDQLERLKEACKWMVLYHGYFALLSKHRSKMIQELGITKEVIDKILEQPRDEVKNKISTLGKALN
jgi:hypothetical protein